jgi:hypothetical protein
VADDLLPATGEVSVGVAATPAALWPLVSDPSMPARFSSELVEARFVGDATPCVGAEIEGRNVNGAFTWSTRSTVVACEAPTCFSWATGGAEAPAATWTFELEPLGGGARLTHRVVLHAGREPLGPALEAEPERAEDIVAERMASVLVNMERVVTGIAALAEGVGEG